MALNWRALVAHLPVRQGGSEHVERSGSVSAQIAGLILSGRSPVLIGGPAGVGRSTELARAAQLLQGERVACLIQVDRFENMRRIQPERLLQLIAGHVTILARDKLHRSLSPELLEEAQAQASDRWSPVTLARRAVEEVARVSEQGRVTLLIDGLEKVPAGVGFLALLGALASLPEQVELAVGIPWHVAFGSRAEVVLRSGERFVTARAVVVDGPQGQAGCAFLQEMLLRRLQLTPTDLSAEQARIVATAARLSGGMPRAFLQLMANAGAYARLQRGEHFPIEDDMNDARLDLVDSFRRLLLPGDADAVKAAVGTDGRELELKRKIRLMAHGILLERLHDKVPLLELHPLAQIAIEGGGGHA